jgi:hypothetical protein
LGRGGEGEGEDGGEEEEERRAEHGDALGTASSVDNAWVVMREEKECETRQWLQACLNCSGKNEGMYN